MHGLLQVASKGKSGRRKEKSAQDNRYPFMAMLKRYGATGGGRSGTTTGGGLAAISVHRTTSAVFLPPLKNN